MLRAETVPTVEEGGLGDDISDLPAVGIAPEWMSEKAIAIGTYCAASGAYVLFGVTSPIKASQTVVDLMSSGEVGCWALTRGPKSRPSGAPHRRSLD